VSDRAWRLAICLAEPGTLQSSAGFAAGAVGFKEFSPRKTVV